APPAGARAPRWQRSRAFGEVEPARRVERHAEAETSRLRRRALALHARPRRRPLGPAARREARSIDSRAAVAARHDAEVRRADRAVRSPARAGAEDAVGGAPRAG